MYQKVRLSNNLFIVSICPWRSCLPDKHNLQVLVQLKNDSVSSHNYDLNLFTKDIIVFTQTAKIIDIVAMEIFTVYYQDKLM